MAGPGKWRPADDVAPRDLLRKSRLAIGCTVFRLALVCEATVGSQSNIGTPAEVVEEIHACASTLTLFHHRRCYIVRVRNCSAPSGPSGVDENGHPKCDFARTSSRTSRKRAVYRGLCMVPGAENAWHISCYIIKLLDRVRSLRSRTLNHGSNRFTDRRCLGRRALGLRSGTCCAWRSALESRPRAAWTR